jgi:hypothetical protein
VPIGASALMSAKLVKNSTLKVYPGFPHADVYNQPGPDQRRLAGVFSGKAEKATA